MRSAGVQGETEFSDVLEILVEVVDSVVPDMTSAYLSTRGRVG